MTDPTKRYIDWSEETIEIIPPPGQPAPSPPPPPTPAQE